jgi:carbonic anhydrase
MGHSKCGAVTAACNDVKLGNITALLSKIKPSVKKYIHSPSDLTEGNIEKVANVNIDYSIDEIRAKSSILKEMEDNGEIKIVGAMYDVSTGKVTFH